MGGVADKAVEIGSLGTIETDFSGEEAAKDAARASRQAASTQAQAQREALDYLKQREEIPQQFRESAIQSLGGLYGLPGGNQQAAQQLRSSPIYEATMGNIGRQEEAILRNQSATGALRTGATDQMLAENQRQMELQALQNTASGVQGLAGLQSYAPQIAQQTAGIGQTQAQGQVAAAQARQQAQQQGMGNLMGLGQLGLAAYGAFCDPALKDNVEYIGHNGGFNLYKWDWNEKAAELGLYGKGAGPMADEIERFYPERIEIRNGYKYVRAANG